MTADPRRVQSIFLAAVELDDRSARAAFVKRETGDDAELRDRVAALLAAHDDPRSFLGRSPDDAIGDGTRNFAPADGSRDDPAVGRTIDGRYKLLERIGEGGMGEVYVAEQSSPVRRLVAVKLVKPGLDSRAILARFEAERQSLALMDHPNIAKALDAGATADGRPYFVMELVKGTPITRFCDERGLTTRERLELFVPVCRAIQHAHQKGVIHRDVKPNNVLVAMYDDRPAPKVIDFGVAKAARGPLTDKTLHTAFGAIVGTPEYMSPEQATFNQLDVDTRSDVYSLGVLLYELLTGTTPVDRARLQRAALLEVLRVVREEEPPRPSVKLSTSEARASAAATRGLEPAKLVKLLRGELDWIALRALEKNRDRRYDSAAALAKDVERYLNDELVEARPPSRLYRLTRFARKNAFALAGVGLALFLSLAWAATVTLLLAARNQAIAAREQAIVEAVRSRAAAELAALAEAEARRVAEAALYEATLREAEAASRKEREN